MPETSESVSIDIEVFSHRNIFFFAASIWFLCFNDPLASLYWWAVSVGGEEFKWCQRAHCKLWSQQGPHFNPHSTAKTYGNSTFHRKNGLVV